MKENINPDEQQEMNSQLADKKTGGDRFAIFMTNIFGSLPFLFFCLVFFAGWIAWNANLLPGLRQFDPYPFPRLGLIVAIFAIVLSVSVLISQNRQGRMEKIRRQVEFEVNVKAETEITKVLDMLHEIQKKMGIATADTELEKMKETLDIEELHQKLHNKKE
jgi:uncharacterized membrane protein